MEILQYSDLDISGVTHSFDRTVAHLRAGDFRAADVKKLSGTPYYRARLDRSDRLLFRFGRHGGRTYLLLLEILCNHAYEKSRFLNGAAVDEDKLLPVPDPETETKSASVVPLIYVNSQSPRFHLLDKVLSFDDLQEQIVAPLERFYPRRRRKPGRAASPSHADLDAIRRKYRQDYFERDYPNVRRKIEKYGIDFRNPLNQTPLMVAAEMGLVDLVGALLKGGANPDLRDNWGRTAFQLVLRRAYQDPVYAAERIGALYEMLAPSCLKVKVEGRLIKLDRHMNHTASASRGRSASCLPPAARGNK